MIHNLEETVKENLRRQAAAHGCSMEEEARRILQEALSQGRKEDKGLGSRIHTRFAEVGGVELPLPERSLPRAVSDFTEPDV
jgi:plasmid stability protein